MTATVQVFTASTLAALKVAIDAGTALTTGALTQTSFQVALLPGGVEYSAIIYTFSA